MNVMGSMVGAFFFFGFGLGIGLSFGLLESTTFAKDSCWWSLPSLLGGKRSGEWGFEEGGVATGLLHISRSSNITCDLSRSPHIYCSFDCKQLVEREVELCIGWP
jgi:hypothetical protein